ncbi:MAG: RluA family pseudouridine synthase, partial [Oscillospiraceae bacterium]|nr:RluA family pseudouridine synthase [Oscillospiraceae bacterium]
IAESAEHSLVECRLVTGRTHQIRAQFAAIGHPLLGDGKYGSRGGAVRGQALYSYRVRFAFRSDAGTLEYLSGRTFEAPLEKIDFVKKYFPSLQTV